MLKKLLVSFIVIAFFSTSAAFAQGSVGVYHTSYYTQLGAGTNPEAKYFGEARLFAGDIFNRFFGLEAIGQYNFQRSEWYNLSGGLMLGYHEFEDFRFGFHGMLAVKPIETHRNLALILDTTPFYNVHRGLSLRASVGIRYTFTRRE
jgi:hypothetical protein